MLLKFGVNSYVGGARGVSLDRCTFCLFLLKKAFLLTQSLTPYVIFNSGHYHPT